MRRALLMIWSVCCVNGKPVEHCQVPPCVEGGWSSACCVALYGALPIQGPDQAVCFAISHGMSSNVERCLAKQYEPDYWFARAPLSQCGDGLQETMDVDYVIRSADGGLEELQYVTSTCAP